MKKLSQLSALMTFLLGFPAMAQLTLDSKLTNLQGLDHYLPYSNSLKINSSTQVFTENDRKSAKSYESYYRLTEENGNQLGGLNSEYLIDISKDFDFNVQLNINNILVDKADGFSFNFYANSRGSFGSTGGVIGANIPFNEGFSLKTYNNKKKAGFYKFINYWNSTSDVNYFNTYEPIYLFGDKENYSNSDSYYIEINASYSSAANTMRLTGSMVSQCDITLSPCPTTIIYDILNEEAFSSDIGSPWRYFAISATTGAESSEHIILASTINATVIKPTIGEITDDKNDDVFGYGENIIYEAVAYNTNRDGMQEPIINDRIGSDIAISLPDIITLAGNATNTNSDFLDADSISSIYYEIREPGYNTIISSNTIPLTYDDIRNKYYSVNTPALKEVYFKIIAKTITKDKYFNSLRQINSTGLMTAGFVIKTKNEYLSEEFNDSIGKTFTIDADNPTTLSTTNTYIKEATINNKSEMCKFLSLNITDESFVDESQDNMCSVVRTTIKDDSGNTIDYPYTIIEGFNTKKFTVNYVAGTQGNDKSVNAYAIEIKPPTLIVNPKVIVVNLYDSINVMLGVSAFDPIGKELTSDILANPNSVNTDAVASISVTYSVTDGHGSEPANESRTYIIKDADGITENNILIDAHNFASKIADKNSVDIISSSNAIAYDLTTGAEIAELVLNPVDITGIAAAGVYPIEITATNSIDKSATKTIYVTITDDNSSIASDGKLLIQANNFTTTVDNASSVDILKSSDAKAYLTDDGSPVTTTAIPTDLTGAEYAIAGVYTIAINATSGTDEDLVSGTKTIYVTITDDNATITSDGKLLIQANNFTTTVDNANSVNILKASDAKAYLTSDGSSATTTAIPDNLTGAEYAIAGVYPIAINATSGADEDLVSGTKTIYVTITDDNSAITSDGKLLIQANNFTTTADNASSVDILKASDAKAYLTDDGSPVTTTAIPTDLTGAEYAIAGVYSIAINATSGTDENLISGSKTIYVTITDDNSSITSDGKLLIQANNFTATADNANSVNILEASDAKAYLTSDGSPATTTAVPANLTGAEYAIAGVYPIAINATSGTDEDLVSGTKTIYVTITDDNATITLDGKLLIQANNFTATADNANSVNILEASDAKAYLTSDGSPVTTTAIPTDLTGAEYAIAGVYPIAINATSETDAGLVSGSKTIYVTITDNNSIYENGIFLTAKSFVLYQYEVDKADILKESSARAQNGNDSESIKPVSVPANLTDVMYDDIGSYYIDITATNDNKDMATKKIKVTIVPNDAVVDADGELMVKAENFDTTINEADYIDIITASNAQAYDNVSDKYTEPHSLPNDLTHDLYNESGVYPIEVLATKSRSTLTLKSNAKNVSAELVKTKIFATIKGPNSIVENGIFIDALDKITINFNDRARTNIVESSKARSMNTATGEILNVNSEPTSLTYFDVPGIYTITLKSATSDASANKPVIFELTADNGGDIKTIPIPADSLLTSLLLVIFIVTSGCYTCTRYNNK